MTTNTAKSTIVTTAPNVKEAKTSLYITDGFTYTSPSLYFEIVGTASFADDCGQLGTKVVSSTIAIPPGVMSTVSFDVPVGDMLPTGTRASKLRQLAPLNTRDLLCPTWGVNMPVSSEGAKSVKIGPPFYPLLVPPPELLTIDVAWSKCVRNHWPLRFGIFDPPRSLTANSVLGPASSVPTPQLDSYPTHADPSAATTLQAQPAQAPAPGTSQMIATPAPTPAPGLLGSPTPGQDPDSQYKPGSGESSSNPGTADLESDLGSGGRASSDGGPGNWDGGEGYGPLSFGSGVSSLGVAGSGSSGSDTADGLGSNNFGSKNSGSGSSDSGSSPNVPGPNSCGLGLDGSSSNSFGSGGFSPDDSGSDSDFASLSNRLEGFSGSALPAPMAAHAMRIGGTTFTEDFDCSCYSLAPSQTLSFGGSITMSDGTVIILASNGASAVIHSHMQHLSPAIARIAPAFASVLGSGGSELGASGDTEFTSGTKTREGGLISYGPEATATFTAHDYALIATPASGSSNLFVLKGSGGAFTTLTPGGTAFTIMGNEVVSLGTDGMLKLNGSTIATVTGPLSTAGGVIGAAVATAFNLGQNGLTSSCAAGGSPFRVGNLPVNAGQSKMHTPLCEVRLIFIGATAFSLV